MNTYVLYLYTSWNVSDINIIGSEYFDGIYYIPTSNIIAPFFILSCHYVIWIAFKKFIAIMAFDDKRDYS